jgi:uncharacterized membrane protein
MWKRIFSSWNPNKYSELKEVSFLRLAKLSIASALFSATIFLALLLPAVYNADATVEQLSKTTNITVSASMQQSIGTYLMKNPDILITTDEGKGFIVITPQSITVKQFVFFGTKTYNWKPLSSLQTLKASEMLVPLFFFLLPSILVWFAIILLVNFIVWTILYTLFAYFILHAKNFHVLYTDLWKVSLYASFPAMMLSGATPILRLGLPLAIVWGLVFVVWLVFSMLGTALFAEKRHRKTAV